MKKFYIINKIDETTAEILVYGYIDNYDVKAADFVKELRDLEKTYANIKVKINSGGGSVFDGFAIFNAIRQSKANIDTYVEGIAASMGSVIAMAGKKVYMAKVARLMTHQASGFAFGTAEEMRQQADLLESLNETVAQVYANKTGKTLDQAKKDYLGNSDKWFTAQQALDDKLIDGIYDAEEVVLPETGGDIKQMWQSFNERIAAKLNQSQNTNENMKQFTMSAAVIAALKLNDNADQAAFEASLNALNVKALEYDAIKAKYDDEVTARTTAENELNTLKGTVATDKIKAITEAAVTGNKITVQMATQLQKDYAGKPDELKTLIDAMPVVSSIVYRITHTSAKAVELDGLVKMSGEELYKADKLERLKELDPSAYKAKYKECFGKEVEETK